MQIRSITETCRRALESRSSVCFGVSPFNSYFSEAKLIELATFGMTEFKSMRFFVPDIPSAFTLEALGYEPEKAMAKAKKQAQYVHNKIHRSLKSVGFSDVEACRMVLNWEVLSGNPRYQELSDTVRALFESDAYFRQSCLAASRWVLEKRVPDVDALSDEVLCSAVRYFLSEIPVFADAAGIMGEESCVFFYHQTIPFLDSLYRGEFAIKPSRSQGFAYQLGSGEEKF